MGTIFNNTLDYLASIGHTPKPITRIGGEKYYDREELAEFSEYAAELMYSYFDESHEVIYTNQELIKRELAAEVAERLLHDLEYSG